MLEHANCFLGHGSHDVPCGLALRDEANALPRVEAHGFDIPRGADQGRETLVAHNGAALRRVPEGFPLARTLAAWGTTGSFPLGNRAVAEGTMRCRRPAPINFHRRDSYALAYPPDNPLGPLHSKAPL